MSDIKIFDNFFSEEDFAEIQQRIMSPHFNWNINTTATNNDGFYSLNRAFITQKDIFSEPLLLRAYKQITEDFSEEKIIRIRCGAIFRDKDYVMHTPHVDYNFPHMTALLYINDSDGDTIFYKEPKESNFEIEKKIKPKQNRLVIFDGMIYHSSSTPTKNKLRFVVNFNWRK